MSDPAPSVIGDSETLARFVFFNRWVRDDKTMRPDAFIPHPYPDLSVTRHIGLTEAEIWQLGEVARGIRTLPLIGRADMTTEQVRNQSLQINPDEPPRNHAIIVGWPADKPSQKIKAQAIAADARFHDRN